MESKIDYDLLKEDLKFPLYPDTYGSYLWTGDKDGLDMVAQFENNLHKSLPLDLIVFDENVEGNFTLVEGDYLLNGEYVGCVRGWGHLQKKTDPEKRQDNIALYLLNLLNHVEKVNQE